MIFALRASYVIWTKFVNFCTIVRVSLELALLTPKYIRWDGSFLDCQSKTFLVALAWLCFSKSAYATLIKTWYLWNICPELDFCPMLNSSRRRVMWTICVAKKFWERFCHLETTNSFGIVYNYIKYRQKLVWVLTYCCNTTLFFVNCRAYWFSIKIYNFFIAVPYLRMLNEMSLFIWNVMQSK